MKLFRVIIALSLLLICNACSENDTITESITGNSELVVITTISNTKSLSDSPSVTATTDGSPIGAILGSNLPASSTMGVYVSGKADGFTQYGNTPSGNLRWKNTSNGWMQVDANDQPQSFKLNANPAYLFGYFPHNSTVSASETNIPVKAGYTDYMYGKEGNQSGTTNKTLVMNHAMSILSFTFRNNGNTGNCKLQGIKLKNLPVSGKMDLITGKITPDASGEVNLAAYESTNMYNPQAPDGSTGFAAEYTFKTQPIGTVNPSGSTYVENTGKFHAIVFPSDNPGNYQIDIKVDGKIKTINFSAANNSLKWEAGKRYIYNIALSSDGSPTIQLDAVIADYDNKGDISEIFGNNVTIEIPNGVNYINRPTWKNEKDWSKSFEVSKTELTTPMSWYDASGRDNNGNTIRYSGCHIYAEEDAKQNWRIPTYREMEAIISAQNKQITPKPILGDYWTSSGKATISLANHTYSIILNYDESNQSKLKARCIRDTNQPKIK